MLVHEFMTTEDLAGRYKVPVETVRKWRANGTGPRGARFGKHVRYSTGDVEEWERQQADRPQPGDAA